MQAKSAAEHKACVDCLVRNPLDEWNGRCVTCVSCFATKDYIGCVKCMDAHFGDTAAMAKCNPDWMGDCMV